MRVTKVVFCCERNKMCKVTNFLGLISVYFIFKIKNGIVEIAGSLKKIKIVQITRYLVKSYAMRGTKVAFSRERNKCVKLQKKMFCKYQCISH